jgi:hypothetical protein
MNRKLHLIVAVALLALFVTACAPAATTPAPDPGAPGAPPVAEVTTYAEFVASLEQQGVAVEERGQVTQPFIDVTGQAVAVQGQEIQVFEFASEQAQRDTTATLGMIRDTIAQAMGRPAGQVHVWSNGRIIVLYAGQDTQTLSMLNRVVGTPVIGGVATDEDLPAAVETAVETLAGELPATVDEFQVVTFESVQWPDGCLGLAEPGEMCTQAIVPGWRVVLQVRDEQYEVRTDMQGMQVRWQQL